MIHVACFSFIGNPLLCSDWLGSICRPFSPKSRGKNLIFCTLFCENGILVYQSSGFSKLTKLLILLSAVFSRAAVVCMALGFITLLSMVIVAVYKSNQPKQLMMGSSKSGQGMYKFIFLFIYSSVPVLTN